MGGRAASFTEGGVAASVSDAWRRSRRGGVAGPGVAIDAGHCVGAEACLLDKATSLSFDPREQNRAGHVSMTLADMARVDARLDPIGGAVFREALRGIEPG